MSGPRIVSLLPSATEVIAAIGLAGHLVGRSHACDYPPEVQAVPVVTAPRTSPAGPSKRIHKDVKALLRAALSPFDIDTARLRALAPDVIVTQHQCDVCAVSEDQLRAAIADWTGTSPDIVSVAPGRIAEVFQSIRDIADGLGRRYQGEALARSMSGRMEAIAARAAQLESKPGVAAIEWLDPAMSSGHWVPELIAMAGGRDLLSTPGTPSRKITLAEIAATDADALVLMPCGFDLARTVAEAPALLTRPTIATMRAARSGHAFAADGNAYFNRPGPRLVDSLLILAEMLQPKAFNFGSEGHAWQRLAG